MGVGACELQFYSRKHRRYYFRSCRHLLHIGVFKKTFKHSRKAVRSVLSLSNLITSVAVGPLSLLQHQSIVLLPRASDPSLDCPNQKKIKLFFLFFFNSRSRHSSNFTFHVIFLLLHYIKSKMTSCIFLGHYLSSRYYGEVEKNNFNLFKVVDIPCRTKEGSLTIDNLHLRHFFICRFGNYAHKRFSVSFL